MKDTLQAGLSGSDRIEVDESRTIGFMGDDCRVYGTNWLVYDIEMTSRNFLLEYLDEGEDSVGTRIAIDHMAATPLGMWIDVTVKITEVEGRMISFELECRDAEDLVARGKHNRFIVDVEKTAERIRQKKSQAA